MDLSERIRNRINELGWNFKVTSEKTGIKYQEVLRLTSGKRHQPRLDTIIKLIKGLRVHPYYILGLDDDMFVNHVGESMGIGYGENHE
jgi:transcriptional regulator with XRE-family HTH domain